MPNITSKGEERFITEVEENTAIGFKYFKFDSISKIGIEHRDLDIEPNGYFGIKLAENGKEIAKIKIDSSKSWTKSYTSIDIPNGTYPLYFVYHGKGSLDVKEIYFE